MWQRHCGTRSDTRKGTPILTVISTQRHILHPHARSSCPWSEGVLSLWVNILAQCLCFHFLALSVQDYSAEVGCVSSVDQLWAQDFWLSTSLLWRYNEYFVFFSLSDDSLIISFSINRFISFLSLRFLRRVCVRLELWWQLWILAQHRWLSPQPAVDGLGRKGMNVYHFLKRQRAEGNFLILVIVVFICMLLFPFL